MIKKMFAMLAFISFLPYGYCQKGKGKVIYKTENKIIYDICFTTKGGALGIADGNSVKVYSTRSGVLMNEFKNGNKDRILTIDISRDSTMLASAGKDSTIILWDFINNKILKSLNYHKGIITSVCFSPDMRYLISGGTDKTVFLYDITLDKVVKKFTEHAGDVTTVAFSHDGQFFASAGGDNLIDIYNTGNLKLIASLDGHGSWVRDICFSKDGKKLLSVGDDSKAITWDISDISNIIRRSESKYGLKWLLCGDFYGDSKTIAIGDLNGQVKITGQYSRYRIRLGKPVQKVLFKPNEGIYLKLAIATRGKGVILIDAKNMKR